MENNERLPYPQHFELPPQLSFMSVDALTDFRDQQAQAMYEARVQAVQNSPLFEASHAIADAEHTVSLQDAEMAEAYVAAHLQRDTNPALFDELKEVVSAHSFFNMPNTEWSVGQADSNGYYSQPETAGHNTLQEQVSQIVSRYTFAPHVTAPSAELIQQADIDLAAARNALAAISIQRRALLREKSGRKAKTLEARYTEAQAAYDVSLQARNSLRAQEWQTQDLTGAQAKAQAIHSLLSEKQAFHQAEMAAITNDDSRRGRLVNRMASHKLLATGGLAGVGAAFGWGVGTISKVALAAAGAMAAPAVAGFVAGAKVGKAVFQAKLGNQVKLLKDLESRHQDDLSRLENGARFHLKTDQDHGSLLNSSRNLLHQSNANRINRDVVGNRNRAIGAAILGGGAALIGFELAQHIGSGHSNTSLPKHTGPKLPGINDNLSGKDTTVKPVVNPEKPDYVDGFNTHITVEAGHGYTDELQDLASQNGITLSDNQAWDAYQQMAHQFGGNLLSDDPSYVRVAGDYGISRPGDATWNPAAVHFFHQWLQQQIEDGKIKKSDLALAS